jgi:hypothetical protein
MAGSGSRDTDELPLGDVSATEAIFVHDRPLSVLLKIGNVRSTGGCSHPMVRTGRAGRRHWPKWTPPVTGHRREAEVLEEVQEDRVDGGYDPWGAVAPSRRWVVSEMTASTVFTAEMAVVTFAALAGSSPRQPA